MSITPECYSGILVKNTPSFRKGLGVGYICCFLRFSFSFTSLIPCLLPPRDEREKTERTTAQLPANKKCCLLIFAIAIGCLVLAAIPASYCPPLFCLSIVSNNIRVPLRSATRLAFASDLANILRSLPVTLEHPEHPSPSPVIARRCPVSRVPIPSRHLVKLSRFRPRDFLAFKP